MVKELTVFFCIRCGFEKISDRIQYLDIRRCPNCDAWLWNVIIDRDCKIIITDNDKNEVSFVNSVEYAKVFKKIGEVIENSKSPM